MLVSVHADFKFDQALQACFVFQLVKFLLLWRQMIPVTDIAHVCPILVINKFKFLN